MNFLEKHEARCALIDSKMPEGLDENAAWRYQRRKTLGGTDVGAILGMNAYVSPHAVWEAKKGLTPEQDENEAMYWGKAMEQPVAHRFEEESGCTLYTTESYINTDIPWLSGSPDRLCMSGVNVAFIWEGKTAGRNITTGEMTPDGEEIMLWGKGGHWENGRFLIDPENPLQNHLPEHYRVQVHCYQIITGCHNPAFLSCLIGGRDYRTYIIPFDESLAVRIVKETRAWWERYILGDEEPPRLARDLKNIEPQKGKLQVTDDLRGVIADLRGVNEQIKALEAQKSRLQDSIADKLGTENDCIVDETGKTLVSYAWTKGRTSVDLDVLQASFPEVYSKVQKTGAGFRTMRLYK